MSQLIAIGARGRRRRRRRYRWSAEEKGRYLDAFRRSGLSSVAFCREMDLSPATLALWKREARRAGERVAFARVDVVPAQAVPTSERRAGLRLVVRGAAGHEAALDGVDGVTAVRLVALVLGRR